MVFEAGKKLLRNSFRESPMQGEGKKVINFNPSANRREIVNFLYIKNVRGWKKYNYSAAMGFNGDVAVVNNFFYPLFFKRKKNSLSTAYHLWYGRVLYKYALFYVVKSARANWINFLLCRCMFVFGWVFRHNPPSYRIFRSVSRCR